MAVRLFVGVLLVCVAVATAEVYFEENFSSDWNKRWVYSDWKKADGTQGKFKLTAGKWYGDSSQKGMQTADDARFYAISAPTAQEFDVEDKTLIFQFTVKHEQKIDCGGAYLKLLPEFEPKTFSGETPYMVMFGPDICGTGTRKTHVIINYNGKNYQTKKSIKAETDQLTHLYKLVIRPDQTYEVYVDDVRDMTGSLLEDFDILPPKQIADPAASKPADWVDQREIDDPEDVKPEGYDDIPATIADPDAEQPEDWNEEEDGEWEVPQIANPEYKGPWKARRIPNPAYKGEWKAPMIDNPDYTPVDKVFTGTVRAVGLEVWQVKAGTIFGSVLVTDDEEYAAQHGVEHWKNLKDAEKEMFDEAEEERRQKEDAERKRMEEERKAADAAKTAAHDDDDDDEEDDHDHDDL